MPTLSTPLPPYPTLANLISQYSPMLVGAQSAAVANQMYAVRVTIPHDGVLHDLGVYITNQSGNLDLGIYDTSATTRNKLYSSGTTVVAAAGTWQTVDPNLAVKRGDHLDFAFACDNAVAAFGRQSTTGGNQMILPTTWMASPLGGVSRMEWAKTVSFPLPLTVLESAFIASTTCPLLCAIITPL